MIVITNIETIDVPGNIYNHVYGYHPDEYIGVSNKLNPVKAELIKEYITGQRFIRGSDGSEIIIGMSKQASEVIGIPLSAWKNQEDYINRLTADKENFRVKYEISLNELHYTKLELDRRKNMSIINKIKFLFGILK